MTDLDPVKVSDNITHPIDFLSTYKDHISGFEGKATGVGYSMHNNIMVILTRKSTDPKKKGESYGFKLQDLESVGGSRLKKSVIPEHEIEFGAEYEDSLTGFKGVAAGIIYSSNKCVQVRLATGDENNNPIDDVTDIQNIKPVDPENTKPITATSNTSPGTTRPISNSDMRDHARGSNNPSY